MDFQAMRELGWTRDEGPEADADTRVWEQTVGERRYHVIRYHSTLTTDGPWLVVCNNQPVGEFDTLDAAVEAVEEGLV